MFSSLSSGSDELGDAKGVPIFVFLTDERYAMERHDFETMLIKEFSVENLLFFHAVRRYVPKYHSLHREDFCVCDLKKYASSSAVFMADDRCPRRCNSVIERLSRSSVQRICPPSGQ